MASRVQSRLKRDFGATARGRHAWSWAGMERFCSSCGATLRTKQFPYRPGAEHVGARLVYERGGVETVCDARGSMPKCEGARLAERQPAPVADWERVLP